MHGVVGGGTMNMLVGEELTYRRPHCVHCQHIRVILPSAMLSAEIVSFQEKGTKGLNINYVGISNMDIERV